MMYAPVMIATATNCLSLYALMLAFLTHMGAELQRDQLAVGRLLEHDR